MSSGNAISIYNWNSNINSHETAICASMPGKSQSGIIAISQANGIGSVYRASAVGVERLFGNDVDGLDQAFVQTLCRSLGLDNLLVTLALKDRSVAVYREIIADISHTLVR